MASDAADAGARPNFLFFLADQHRHDWLGSNARLPVRTPHLDALAGRGVRFTNALCPAPFCAPSRACLASGRDYETCGVPDNRHDFPLEMPTYYRALRDAGYRVAGVGKFDLHKGTQYWGRDGTYRMEDWGFTHGIDSEGKWDAITSGAERPAGPYMAYLHERGLADLHVRDFAGREKYATTRATPLPDDAYCDNWIAGNGLDVLKSFTEDAPWHLVVNFAGPHEPMDVTGAMKERWKEVEFPPPHAASDLDPETHQEVRRNYAAMIENIDRHVGAYLEELAARADASRTVVIYASDHGEMLGEHGLWEKCTYHRPSIGVPLTIAGPGVKPGVVSHELVLLQDLAATFLDLAGQAPLPGMTARSLVDHLAGSAERVRSVSTSALADWRALFDGRYELVERTALPDLLFDLERDPLQDVNLFDHPGSGAAQEAERLRRDLASQVG